MKFKDDYTAVFFPLVLSGIFPHNNAMECFGLIYYLTKLSLMYLYFYEQL